MSLNPIAKVPAFLGGSVENFKKFNHPTVELFSRYFKVSNVKPKGYPDAYIFEMGDVSNSTPLAVTYNEECALFYAMVADITGMSTYLVPAGKYIRHNNQLDSLRWFLALEMAKGKLSTAGNGLVWDDGLQKEVPIFGKAGNMFFRKEGKFACAIRPLNKITYDRSFVNGSYAEDKSRCDWGLNGNIHTESNSEDVRWAVTFKKFLVLMQENGAKGVVKIKPTIGWRDKVFALIVLEFFARIGITPVTAYADERADYRPQLDSLFCRLGSDFLKGIDVSKIGEIHCVLTDDAYGKVLLAISKTEELNVVTNDEGGDNGPDLSRDSLPAFAVAIDKFLTVNGIVLPEGLTVKGGMRNAGYQVDVAGVAALSEMINLSGESIWELVAGTDTPNWKLFMQGLDACHVLTAYFDITYNSHKSYGNIKEAQYAAYALSEVKDYYKLNGDVGTFKAYYDLKEIVIPITQYRA